MPLVPDRTPDRGQVGRYCDELERMARAFALPVEVTDDGPVILVRKSGNPAADATLEELAEACRNHHPREC